MTKYEARERIKKLRDEINRHRYQYHVHDTQEISEAALDSLKHELAQLEQQFPGLVTPDSPTQRVGGKPLSKFEKVVHSKPVLSLEDAFATEEIEEWQKRNEKLLDSKIHGYYCELKLDGLSVVLTYRNGIFVQGATRGDGRVGEDVTQNLKTIESIPLKLEVSGSQKIPPVLEVRGEIVISKKNLEILNREREKKSMPVFANPRNLAAGSIRQLDPVLAASRKLESCIFDLITDIGQKTHAEAHEKLANFGFKISPYSEQVKDLHGVFAYLKKWEKKREQIPYNTDGAVIVVNDVREERYLGSVGKTDRWMIAYKFPAEQGTTRVEDIIIQVGRTGALTPVAILSPVRLAGTTVSRATLHNEDEIRRLDVRIGDTVIVEKAGDIIPDVVQVLTKLRTGTEKKFAMPKKCPVCSSAVIRKSGEVAQYCSNKKCFAIKLEGLIHFVSKKGFNIDGLGEKIVEQLMNAGLVRDAADFFALTVDDVLPLERFAEKSAENLIAAIGNAKKVSLSNAIYALGIRHVGEETARTLAQRFGGISALQRASREALRDVEDIGGVVAESIADWFADAENVRLIERLQSAGVKFMSPIKEHRGARPLAGKTLVITGTLPYSRDEVASAIRLAGGKVAGSVSKKTDFVVAGDNPGSKYEAAKAAGVTVISYQELQKLLTDVI